MLLATASSLSTFQSEGAESPIKARLRGSEAVTPAAATAVVIASICDPRYYIVDDTSSVA